jgi:hypothetical protein
VTEKHPESSAPAEPQPGFQTLEYYEVIIERARSKPEEEALALLEIHDQRLYQPEHSSFGDYLWNRWQMKRSRGYQLLHWARLKKTSTEANPADPLNERQARRLDAQGQVRNQRAKDWTTRAMDYVVKAWDGLAESEHREFIHYLRSLLNEIEQRLNRVANADHRVVGPG